MLAWLLNLGFGASAPNPPTVPGGGVAGRMNNNGIALMATLNTAGIGLEGVIILGAGVSGRMNTQGVGLSGTITNNGIGLDGVM